MCSTERTDVISTLLPVRSLHPMVRSTVWPALLPSIEAEGLKNPIVVVPTSKEEWLEQKTKVHYMLDPPDTEEEIFQVRCGNNRLRAVEELGWDVVPVLICSTVQEAATICRQHELWYKQKYGPL